MHGLLLNEINAASGFAVSTVTVRMWVDKALSPAAGKSYVADLPNARSTGTTPGDAEGGLAVLNVATAATQASGVPVVLDELVLTTSTQELWSCIATGIALALIEAEAEFLIGKPLAVSDEGILVAADNATESADGARIVGILAETTSVSGRFPVLLDGVNGLGTFIDGALGGGGGGGGGSGGGGIDITPNDAYDDAVGSGVYIE